MSWKEHRRSNLSVQAILSILEEEGLNSADCLSGTGLKPSDILNVETKISDALEIEITERALKLLPEKAGYGIRAGKALRVTTFGIWGLAILASPNMRGAFDVISRFAELSYILSKVSLVEQGDRAEFVLAMDHLPETIHRFMFERYYATSVTFLREMLPSIDLSQFTLHLPFVDAAYENDLADITGRTVVSAQPAYALATSRAWLEQPLPQADPLTHAHFVSQCQSLLNQRKKLPNYSQMVRDHIVQSHQYAPRLADVAAKAGMSQRSFRRRLEEEGTSFTQIVLETKLVLAKELLSAAGLPVSAVANRLGYSETASFTRAFTQWWGESPSHVRRKSNV